jgi:hypothetical protein
MLSTMPVFGAKDAWITAPLAISLLALGFTVASFWWIQVRRGRLHAYTGYVFTAAIAQHKTVIYIPMVFHNPAPAPQAVVDLRLRIEDGAAGADRAALPLGLFWIATHTTIYPDSNNRRTYASPFAVEGRKNLEKVVEFQAENVKTDLLDGPYQATVEVRVQPRRWWSRSWRPVLKFDLNSQLWTNDRGSMLTRSNDQRYYDAMG